MQLLGVLGPWEGRLAQTVKTVNGMEDKGWLLWKHELDPVRNRVLAEHGFKGTQYLQLLPYRSREYRILAISIG